MTGGRSIREAVEFYSAMFERDQVVWDAFCWTVIIGDYSDDQLLSRLSMDTELLPPLQFDELVDLRQEDGPKDNSQNMDALAWLVRSGNAIGLLEINGFAGSLTQTLSALTAGSPARAVSVYRNEAIGRANLAYAEAGDVQLVDLVLEDYESVTVAALADALAELSTDARFEARGMAVVERLSGVRLDDTVLSQEWPAIRFQIRQLPRPEVPDTAMFGDAEFALALLHASTAVRRAVQIELVEEVMRATDLTEEPAAAAQLLHLKSGEVPALNDQLFALLDTLSTGYQIPARGKVDITHLGWRRLQAGNVLFALSNPRDDSDREPRRFQSWLSASYALGDDWPTARTRYLAMLRQSD